MSADLGTLPPVTTRGWLRLDVVERVLKRIHPASILEIGCGQGAFGARLTAFGDYLGVEPDEASFAVAASRIVPRGGDVLNGTDLDIEPGRSFDLVCSFEVLEHIEDDVKALSGWVQRVRPGGTLLLSVPAFNKRMGPMDERVGHFRRYDPDVARALLADAGLVDIEVTVYGWPIGYPVDALRNRIDARALARAKDRSREELTAASGRLMQPSGRFTGLAAMLLMLPFRYIQRLRPDAGVGLVVVARRPE